MSGRSSIGLAGEINPQSPLPLGEGQGEGIFEGAYLGVRPQHRVYGMPISPAGTRLPGEPLFLPDIMASQNPANPYRFLPRAGVCLPPPWFIDRESMIKSTRF